MQLCGGPYSGSHYRNMSAQPTPDGPVRCDACGRPIDMEHAGDELSTMVFEDGADHEFSADAARDAMVRMLHRGDPTPAEHMLADAIEEDGTYVAHQECLDGTCIADLQTMDDFVEP